MPAVDPSAIARVVGIETTFRDLRGGSILFLPQRVAVVGQGSTLATYPTTKKTVFSAQEVGDLYGYGSPLHLAVKQLLPINGDGVGAVPVTVYPLEDATGATATESSITPVGTSSAQSTYTVVINNMRSEAFTLPASSSVADFTAAATLAVNAVLDLPVTAADDTTAVTLTAKWAGTSGDSLAVMVEETTASGFTFGVAFTSGTVEPDVDDALTQVGDVWETLFINCQDINDGATLDKYSAFGEGRWGSLTRKPCVVFTANTAASVTGTPTTIPAGRATDRTNCQIPAPASDDLPFAVAARAVARIASVANNNPARDFGGQILSGLTPGPDGDQWDYSERDFAVKNGCSTTEVRDGVIQLSDTVTMYHPTNDPLPAYRFVKDIIKLQNIIFNLDVIFAGQDWNGAPLIPDDQPTVNRDAKKPKSAVAAVCSMIDSLALNAIISDPETAKAATFANINPSNPNRLDVTTTVQLSGNSNIISVDLDFGFYFGQAQVVA